MTPCPRPGRPKSPPSPAAPSPTRSTTVLLANTIAHQWWGVSVSPASRDDWWLSDGFARYSEARYVEQAAGQAGLEETVKDMSVGALAYDTVPLSSAGQARSVLARVPVAGHRQGRHDPAHVALGDGRSEIRPDHAHFRRQVRGQVGVARRFPRPGRTELWREAHLVLLAVARFDRRA